MKYAGGGVLLISRFLTAALLAATFAICCYPLQKGLDPDQDRQNVGPNLDPNYLTL